MKDAILYKVLRPIITVLFKCLFTPKIIGKDNIPKEGRVILAGNHTGIMDALLLISSTKRNVHFLAKNELWKGPKKILFGNMGLIPVDRKNKDPKALSTALEYLESELMIGIFPEGTTEKEGHMLPFKIGAVKMASSTNAPIIPFVIKGKYRLFSRNLSIEFLDSFKVKGDLEKENERLRNIIKEKRG